MGILATALTGAASSAPLDALPDRVTVDTLDRSLSAMSDLVVLAATSAFFLVSLGQSVRKIEGKTANTRWGVGSSSPNGPG